MDQKTYTFITEIIKQHKGHHTKDIISILQKKLPEQPFDTLYSILSLEYQKKMKTNHSKSTEKIQRYWNEYKQRITNGEAPGVILRMSQKFDICPCLIAKLILQKYFENNTENKDNINNYLRNTKLIEDMDLAYECTMYDNLYSPLSNAKKHSLGQQFEIKLHNEAKELGLIFRNEEELRKHGYDKTPDIKLEIPVAVDGFVINWVESKALFGDAEIHKEYTNNQYLSYWNRFGPGLVIYWFGFLQSIVEYNDKRFIIRNCLSRNVVHIKTS